MARRRNGHAKNPKPWEPDARQLEIYERVIRGRETYKQIGAAYGVAPNTAYATYKKVNAWFVPQILDDIKEEKARQVAMLRNVVAEAFQAWDRSQQDATVTKSGVSADKVMEITEVRGQSGDPRFLTVVLHALEDIRKILGADAPLEIRHSGEVRVAGRTIDEVKAEAFRNIQALTPRN